MSTRTVPAAATRRHVGCGYYYGPLLPGQELDLADCVETERRCVAANSDKAPMFCDFERSYPNNKFDIDRAKDATELYAAAGGEIPYLLCWEFQTPSAWDYAPLPNTRTEGNRVLHGNGRKTTLERDDYGVVTHVKGEDYRFDLVPTVGDDGWLSADNSVPLYGKDARDAAKALDPDNVMTASERAWARGDGERGFIERHGLGRFAGVRYVDTTAAQLADWKAQKLRAEKLAARIAAHPVELDDQVAEDERPARVETDKNGQRWNVWGNGARTPVATWRDGSYADGAGPFDGTGAPAAAVVRQGREPNIRPAGDRRTDLGLHGGYEGQYFGPLEVILGAPRAQRKVFSSPFQDEPVVATQPAERKSSKVVGDPDSVGGAPTPLVNSYR